MCVQPQRIHVYYFNPGTLHMSWKQPEGTIACEHCTVDFAKRFCTKLRQALCLACWTRAHADVTALRERFDLVWKELSGGVPGSDRVLELIDVYPDHSEADGGFDLEAAGQASSELVELQQRMCQQAEERRKARLRMLETADSPEEIAAQERYAARMASIAETVKLRVSEESTRAGVRDVIHGAWAPETSTWPTCAVCGAASSDRHCTQCDDLFCAECFADKHHGELAAHKFQVVSRASVHKVRRQFDWPSARTGTMVRSGGLSAPEAFRRARDVMAPPPASPGPSHATHVLPAAQRDEHTVGSGAAASLRDLQWVAHRRPSSPAPGHGSTTLQCHWKVGATIQKLSETSEGVIKALRRQQVVPPDVIAGMKAASFEDLELDEWLGTVLHIPKKQCIRYSMALGEVGCLGLRDLIDGRGLVPLESDQDLVDLGFRRGHARRLCTALAALRESGTPKAEEDEFYSTSK